MKYALIKNNIVEQISYPFVEGWEEVNDNVFAGMVKKLDGTFDYTDEVKQQIENIEQEKQDAITKKASGKQKLLDLGLTEEEVKALIGV
jgi:phosphosulfolactate phosphohydrolase-like enzyme